MLNTLSKDALFAICEHLKQAKDIANLRRTCKHLNNKIPLCLAESKSPLIDLIKTGKLKALKFKALTIESNPFSSSERTKGNEHYQKDTRDCNNEALRCACENGHLEVVQWLTHHFGLTIESNPFSSSLRSERTKGNEHDRKDARADNNWALFCACGNGHLEVAQWLTHHFSLTIADARSKNNQALRWACYNGHLAVAQWLTHYFGLTIDDARAYNNQALRWACSNGHLAVAQWLTEYFGLTIADTRSCYNSACANGHLEVVQWLTEYFSLTIAGARFGNILASKNGHLEIVQWLTERFGLTSEDASA